LLRIYDSSFNQAENKANSLLLCSVRQFITVASWFVLQGCHDSLLAWSDSYLQRVIGLPLSLVILTQVIKQCVVA
jgi:hypothetical protein